ncbi:MAG: hypothetical protein VKJ06_08600 [Vampirovibrionales bacterium]|nr:hypothetical protein [Vampirovibrionales bacterium]
MAIGSVRFGALRATQSDRQAWKDGKTQADSTQRSIVEEKVSPWLPSIQSLAPSAETTDYTGFNGEALAQQALAKIKSEQWRAQAALVNNEIQDRSLAVDKTPEGNLHITENHWPFFLEKLPALGNAIDQALANLRQTNPKNSDFDAYQTKKALLETRKWAAGTFFNIRSAQQEKFTQNFKKFSLE